MTWEKSKFVIFLTANLYERTELCFCMIMLLVQVSLASFHQEEHEMRAKKAVVAGHICLDITPVFPANAHTPDIGRLLRPGKLVHMDGVSVHTGGCVANTGLAMKILGADVRLLAKVGDE